VIVAKLMTEWLPGARASGGPPSAGVVVAAVAITLAVGVVVGLFHALLINQFRLPPFIATLATMAGLPRTRVGEVLAIVELQGAAHRRAGTYSMGMRQRLGLAAALLGDPKILVLDEPVNGLDPRGIRWLRTLLREHAARGGTVLLSSHVLSEAAQTVDDVVVIDDGRLVHQGSMSDLERRGESLEDVFFELTGGSGR
jgi:ABC-2 type transport system ATP-binding protein